MKTIFERKLEEANIPYVHGYNIWKHIINDHPPDKIIRVQDLSQKTGLSPITITEILYILESLDLLVVYYISRHNKCRKVIKKDRIDNDDEYFCDHCLEDIDSEKDIIVETVFYNKGV